jgi:hypothetical protein
MSKEWRHRNGVESSKHTLPRGQIRSCPPARQPWLGSVRTIQDNTAHSPPELGGDASRSEGWGGLFKARA